MSSLSVNDVLNGAWAYRQRPPANIVSTSDKSLSEQGISNLTEWLHNSNNVYVGHTNTKARVCKSKWCMSYSSAMVGTRKAMELYLHDLARNNLLTQVSKELRGKTLGAALSDVNCYIYILAYICNLPPDTILLIEGREYIIYINRYMIYTMNDIVTLAKERINDRRSVRIPDRAMAVTEWLSKPNRVYVGYDTDDTLTGDWYKSFEDDGIDDSNYILELYANAYLNDGQIGEIRKSLVNCEIGRMAPRELSNVEVLLAYVDLPIGAIVQNAYHEYTVGY